MRNHQATITSDCRFTLSAWYAQDHRNSLLLTDFHENAFAYEKTEG